MDACSKRYSKKIMTDATFDLSPDFTFSFRSGLPTNYGGTARGSARFAVGLR